MACQYVVLVVQLLVIQSSLLWTSTICQRLTLRQIRLIDEAVTSMMACNHVPGLTLALVRGNETLLTKGYGYRNVQAKIPVTTTTLFNVGSTTKAFTSTLAAEAVDRKKVAWDTPLTTYFGPDFALEGEFRTQEASLRDALAHKLGLPSYWGITTAALNISRAELVRRMRWFPTLYPFRSQYLYSNYGLVLAGAAVEKATGQPWEQAVRDIIFSPLNMTNTRVAATLTEDDWRNRVAISYTYANNTFLPHDERTLLPSIQSIAPAGAVYSCAEDITQWMKFHLNYGKGPDGRQLVSRKSLQDTYTPTFAVGGSTADLTTDVFPVDDIRGDYGLAWYTGEYRGIKKVYHTGSYSGYACRITLLHAKQVAVWACANGGDPSINLVHMLALDIALGETPWLNATSICTFPAPWKPSKPVADYRAVSTPRPSPGLFGRNATELAGNYTHRAFGTFHVKPDLTYEFGTLLRGRLLPDPRSPDHFFQTLAPPLDYRLVDNSDYPHGYPVTFIRNNRSQVAAIRIPYLEFDLPPIFTKY